jgi:predicted nucleic acid-binding Zn ribbon protein
MEKRNLSGFSALGDVLKQELEKRGLDKKVSEHKAVVLWEDMAGNELSRHTQATKVRNHILFVKVDSPVLRNELTYLKPNLLGKIKTELPESEIEDIFFH